MTKQEAFSFYEARRKEFLDYARWVAKRLYFQKGNVSTDDLWPICGLPDDVNSKVYGAIFNTTDWEMVAMKKTNRKTSNGRRIGVWRYIGPRDYAKPADLPFYEPKQLGLI